MHTTLLVSMFVIQLTNVTSDYQLLEAVQLTLS